MSDVVSHRCSSVGEKEEQECPSYLLVVDVVGVLMMKHSCSSSTHQDDATHSMAWIGRGKNDQRGRGDHGRGLDCNVRPIRQDEGDIWMCVCVLNAAG